MRCLYLAAAGMGIVLAGCAVKPDPELDRLNGRFAEINHSLAELDRTLRQEPAASPEIYVTNKREIPKAQLGKLAEIKPLPPDPTKAEVAAYVKAIVDSDTDTDMTMFILHRDRVLMLKAIGKEFIDELLPYAGKAYVNVSIMELLAGGDTAAADILKYLPYSPMLSYRLPRDNPADTKAAVFKTLKESRSIYLHTFRGWVISFIRTAEDRKFMEECFIQNPAAFFLIEPLSVFPETDVDGLLDKAWEARKQAPADERMALAREIWRYGSLDAFEYLLEDCVREPEKNFMSYGNIFHYYFEPPQPADLTAIRDFVRRNKADLKFNRKTGKYYLNKGK